MESKKKILIIAVLVSLAAGFAGGFYYNQFRVPGLTNLQIINRDSGQSETVDFSLFWNVWDAIHARYVDKDKLDTQELVYGAINGMVEAVGDPYTVFLEPKESDDLAQEINGFFGGVGIEIGIRENKLIVIAPISGTPADRAGLLAGDWIGKVGDKSTEGMKLSEAVNLIRGPKGTSVKLTITRKDGEIKEVSIIRDTIKIPTVSLELLDDNIAYIKLSVFNRNVDDDFKKIAKELAQFKAEKIILDLRNNPGGLLDSAINISGYFLEPNQLVTFERFADGKEDAFRAESNGKLKEYPLVILINKGSASASEIVAGAIRDNRGVTLVGEKSFGKGSVQEIDNLPGKASIKITIAKWFTPNGTSINDNGIEPDITVERTEEDINADKDPQLDKAKEIAKSLR